MLLLVFKRKNVLQTQAHARNRLTHFKKFFFFPKSLRSKIKCRNLPVIVSAKLHFVAEKGGFGPPLRLIRLCVELVIFCGSGANRLRDFIDSN